MGRLDDLLPLPGARSATRPFAPSRERRDATDLERLEALVAALRAAVLVEDEQGRIVLVNQAFCALWGVKADPSALVGADRRAAGTVAMGLAEDPAWFARRASEILAGRVPVNDEEIVLADGRVLECDYQPIWTSGSDAGHLWLFRDVTAERQAEVDLRAARDAALDAARAKADFLATMSHEIRTPMHGVLATLELLQATGLDDAQQELLSIVEHAARSLRTVLDDILDVSKIDAGQIRLERVAMDVGAVVRRTVELSRPAAQARGIALAVDVAPGAGTPVLGDPARLAQIVHNLVSNAVKFTDEGSVTVGVDLREHADGDRRAMLTVADTGVGIRDADLPRLFDPFAQADPSTSRRYGGTGLGLAIVRRLVHLMGGMVCADSKLGAGSTFAVVLPYAPAAAPASSPAIAADEPPVGLSGVVLLVEDQEINRRVIVRQLHTLGLEVDVAVDGHEALRRVAGRRYDAVLMDCHMPDLDGYEATRRLRRLSGCAASVPVIALTASALPEDREACLAAGMDAHLPKPVGLAGLRDGLAPWLARGRAAGPEPEGADAVDPAPAQPVDRAVLDAVVGDLGDREIVRGVVGLFLEELPRRVTAIRDAVAAHDGRALHDAAHALKSPSATLGALRLAELCDELQAAARAAATPDGELGDLVTRLTGEAQRVAAALPGAVAG